MMPAVDDFGDWTRRIKITVVVERLPPAELAWPTGLRPRRKQRRACF